MIIIAEICRIRHPSLSLVPSLTKIITDLQKKLFFFITISTVYTLVLLRSSNSATQELNHILILKNKKCIENKCNKDLNFTGLKIKYTYRKINVHHQYKLLE